MRILFLFLVAIFCHQFAFAQNAEIHAEIKGVPDGTTFFLNDSDENANIDSARLSGGRLTLRPKVGTTKGYYFQGQAGKDYYWCYLLVGAGDKLYLKGSAGDFPFLVTIAGAKEQEINNIFRKQTAPFNIKRDSLTNILMPLAMGKQSDSIRAITKPLSAQVRLIDDTVSKITIAFINKHYNSFAAVQELYYMKNKFTKEQLIAMLARLSPEYKKTTFALQLNNYLRVGEPVKKGNLYFDFAAHDINDKPYRLKDFAGKYILLDFTETYCGPCIMANEDLKILYSKYKDSLQIISFYADKTKKVMLEGLKRDKPEWITLTDGMGTGGDTLLKYGVNSYPTFLIIDPKGKVVARFTGYGKDDNGKGSVQREVEKVLSAVR